MKVSHNYELLLSYTIITICRIHSTSQLIESTGSSLEITPIQEDSTPTGGNVKDNDLDKQFQQLSKALIISIAYSSCAGGMGTIIGTPVNLVLKGQADE